MTKDEIIEMARQSGLVGKPTYTEGLVAFANLVADKVTQQEQDRCCAIIFGQCESDNVAQRTVNAIRVKHDTR
jgi:hypothetical protein